MPDRDEPKKPDLKVHRLPRKELKVANGHLKTLGQGEPPPSPG